MLAPKRNESPVHYWISLWPTAPMFGVKWRFEGVAPTAAFFNPVDVVALMARASAEEAARAADEQARAAAAAINDAVVVSRDAAAAALDAASAAARKAAEAAPAPRDVAEAVATVAEAVQQIGTEPVEAVEAPETAAEAPRGSVFADDAPAPPAVLYAEPPAEVDDLTRIKGVGPKMQDMLNAMGVYRLDQIADFTTDNLLWVDGNLTSFKGRPLRDDWVAQAKALL